MKNKQFQFRLVAIIAFVMTLLMSASALAMAPVNRPAFVEDIVCFQDICLSYNPQVVGRRVTQSLELDVVEPLYTPGSILFSFPDYLIGHEDGLEAEIRLYSIDEWISSHMQVTGSSGMETIDKLGLLLADQPTSIENAASDAYYGWFQSPVGNYGVSVMGKGRYLDSRNIRAVRYLAGFGQDLSPLKENSLMYVYRGISNDGKYFINAQFPVRVPIAPGPAPTNGDWESIKAYNAAYAARFELVSDSSFAPALSDLDAMMRSLTTYNPDFPTVINAPRISKGLEVVVTNNLRMRSAPDAAASVVTMLAANTRLRILDGPRSAGGYQWWKVQTIDSSRQEGWCVGTWMQVLPSAQVVAPTPTRVSPTPQPTPTRVSPTAEPPSPPVPQPVPTPAQPKFRLKQVASLKSGPGNTFRTIRTARTGTEFVITAKANVGNAVWWQVYDDQEIRLVWVADASGSAFGDTFRVTGSPLANKVNLAGVNALENGACGNVMVFRQPRSASWQGHVAFAILTGQRSFWGSIDGVEDVLLDNKTSEKAYSSFALAKIIADMKRAGYTDFNFVPVYSGCNWDAAEEKWQAVKTQKYSVIDRNCADAVNDVLISFGVKDLPPLDTIPVPNWWFSSFPSPWKYGELYDY